MATPEEQALVELMLSIHKGESSREAAGHMQELVRLVKERGKGGDVTIKLSVKPPKDLEGGELVHVTMTSTLHAPPLSRGATAWFIQPDGLLARAPANQASFFDTAARVVAAVDVRNPGEDSFRAAGER